MKATPEELWQLAINGNQAAWSRLYETFGNRLYQFFLKNTQNVQLSMDKVQEVFLKIYRNKESFKYGSLKTWIFRIAKNLLIDEWRKSGKKEILSEFSFDVKDENLKVEEQVLKSIQNEEMKIIIDKSMDKLKEADKLTLGLIYLGGLSIPEFSKVMEIPLGTAKTRLRQARLRLDRIIKEEINLIGKKLNEV